MRRVRRLFVDTSHSPNPSDPRAGPDPEFTLAHRRYLAVGWIARCDVDSCMLCGAAFGLALAKCEDDSDKAYEFDCIPLPNDYKFLTLGASALVVQAIFTLFLMWRWQASRDYITKIVAAHHSLVANLAVHLGENAGGMRAQARASAIHSATTFLRYVNLGHAIIYVKAAGDDKENRDKALDAMVGRGLLQPGEESYVRMVDSPSAVFAWAVLQLDKMIKVGTVEECHNIKQVSTHLREIIDNCQDVLTSTEHQLPYPFVQLIMLVQAVFISQLVMVCGGVIGDAITDDVYVTSGVVTGCVTLVTMLLVSLCMSNLFNQLCNPMGKEGPNAFPQNYYVAKIEKDTKVVFDLLYQAGMNGVTNKSRK